MPAPELTRSNAPSPSADLKGNPAGRYYRPGLDVVRFIAFLMVFLWHVLPPAHDSWVVNRLGVDAAALYAATLNGLRFGLCLFFTLSAFLIFELLLRERQSTGSASIKRFYLRRILRIWPLYYLGLLLGLWWAFTLGSGADNLPALGSFAVFAGSWFVTTHDWMYSPADVLWSISVEEQFYLVAPWLAKYCGRGVLFGFCALVVAVSNWTLYIVAGKDGPIDKTWSNSLVQFECFAAGILLCLCLNGRIPRMRAAVRAVVFAGAATSWLIAGSLFNAFYQSGPGSGSWQLMVSYALAGFGSSLVLLAMLDFRMGRDSRWAVHLGRISYGLYVFHEFVIELFARIPTRVGVNTLRSLPLRGGLELVIRVVAPLLVTWALAELSYRFFERPFLRLKERLEAIATKPQQGAEKPAIAAAR